MSKLLVNEAVLAQAISHLRSGQLKRYAEVGLEPEILAQLQQPFVMSLLTDTPVSWVEVRMNADVTERVLTTAECPQQEKLQIERTLKLGVTTTMIQSLFGLSPEGIATKWLIMVIHPRQGRWRQLDGTLEHQIWYRWEHLMQKNRVNLDDSSAPLNTTMILTKEISAGTDQDNPEFTSLVVVWSLIQS